MEITGLKFNPYNPCVENNIMHRKKLTSTKHVDDTKTNHVYPRDMDDFIKFIDWKY